MKQLSKKQAIELLPLVVDGEADSDSELAFYCFIENHREIRSIFTSMRRIKHLIRERVPRAKAPAHLRQRVSELIERESRLY